MQIKLPGEKKSFKVVNKKPFTGDISLTDYNKYTANDFKPGWLNTKENEEWYKIMKKHKVDLYASPKHSVFVKRGELMENEKVDLSVLHGFNPSENEEKTAELDEASEAFLEKLGAKKCPYKTKLKKVIKKVK